MGLQWEGLGSFQYSFNRMGMCLFSLQGVGLSVHSPFRVATETTTFAMPETAIGRTIFCMCVYVCVYVRIYMYMYICVCVPVWYVCSYTCIYVCVCGCVVCMYMYVYMCMSVCTRYVLKYFRICLNTCTCNYKICQVGVLHFWRYLSSSTNTHMKYYI